MATFNTTMWRISIGGDNFVARIVEAATQYRNKYNQVPNVAHVPYSAGPVPASVGVVRIIQVKGLQTFDIDLGYQPETVVYTVTAEQLRIEPPTIHDYQSDRVTAPEVTE